MTRVAWRTCQHCLVSESLTRRQQIGATLRTVASMTIGWAVWWAGTAIVAAIIIAAVALLLAAL